MTLSAEASEFLEFYYQQYPRYQTLATMAEGFIVEWLQDHEYDLHVVSGRAKTPGSLRAKILRKPYRDPAREINDLVGVRVITYYGAQVDKISDRLRMGLTVDENLDKRNLLLETGQFGYRSVHLIGKLSQRNAKEYPELKGMIFEIQIRSVLDHAWAEIEHEIVYKSGIVFPDTTRRKFAAVAGSFELLEDEFLRLREDTDRMIDAYVCTYGAGREKSTRFDAARLTAALEVLRPEAKGWRRAARTGAPFTTPMRTVLTALSQVGITNWTTLNATLRRPGFRTRAESYASLTACTPDDVSHLAIGALAVGYKDPKVLRLYLPEVASAPEIRELFPEQ